MDKGIAVAGNIAVDQLKIIDKYPEPSKLTTIREVSRSLGGAVSNCLIDLAKMDSKLALKALGMVGTDENGDFVLKTMGQFLNINLSGITRQGKSSFTDVMADESNKTRTFFTYRGISSQFSAQHINLDNLEADILHIAYILLLDSMDAPDNEYGTVMARVLSEAKKRGIQTSIDVVSEESERYGKLVPPSLKYTDYCILNEIEASRTVGIDLRSKDGQLITKNIPQVLKKLKGMGVTRWVIIHTPEASFGIDENANYHIRSSLLLPEGFIKGTVGAGDAYVAGVLYSAYKGYSMERGMEIGTAAAACSLSEIDSTSGMKSIDYIMLLYDAMPKQNIMQI